MGDVVQYVVAGPLTLDAPTWDAATGGSGGLVPGQPYYLSQTEPGHLTALYPFTGTAVKIGIALNATTLNVQIESGQTDGYTLVKRAPGPGPYSAVAYGFASGQDLQGRSDTSWQLAPTATIPGTPIYKNLVGGTNLTGQQAASADTWLSSHVLGLTTPTPPMAPPIEPSPRKLESFISGGLFEMTEAQWDAVWTASDPNRGAGSGLLPGYPYYLSDVPGTFFLIDKTGTPPVASGNWITKCFVALSTNTALIQIGDPRKVTTAGPGEEAFALLDFDWQAGTITSAKNLSTPVVVNVGIRDFTFDVPLDDPNLAVITVSAEPIVVDGQIDPPIQISAKITGGGTGLRVTMYPTQAPIAGNAVDPTDDGVRAYVRVDRVAP